MPYRGGKEAPSVAPAREGLVADMVRQFADPHAFVRELVQNGIDAGASAIEVAARFDGTRASFSVTDDGSGMSRDIIEGPLLTLFTSAKDGDPTKIGKYGVGFVSVFAIDPERVEVDTWQVSGQAWQLTLLPDHRYELRRQEASRRTSPSGTRVTLLKDLDADGFEQTASAVGAALSRWCRHAATPLHWIVERAGSTHRERADRPLSIASPLSVGSELEDARLVVGVARGAAYLFDGDTERPLGGFYNRGLTLAERNDGELAMAGVRFKIDSPALQHTLSRDDVRRDETFHRLVRHVGDVVRGPLRQALVGALAQAAEEGDPLRYVALLAAASGPGAARLEPAQIAVPLCDPVGGREVMTALELIDGDRPVLWSHEPNALTAALAAGHRPVVWAVHDDVPPLLEPIVKVSVEPAEATYLLLEVVAPGKTEEPWLKETGRVLARAGVGLHPLRVADVSGSAPIRAAYTLEEDGRRRHLVHAVAHPRFSRSIRKRRLALCRQHPAVKAASRLARRSPATAGQLLARYLLVEDRGELSRGICDDLLEAVSLDAAALDAVKLEGRGKRS